MRSIFLNSLPKSGTVYLYDTLKTILEPLGFHGVASEEIGAGAFPARFLSRVLVYRHACTNPALLSGDHAAPHRINVATLEQFFPKVLIQVRDPRQATLSWLHHFNRFYSDDLTTRVLRRYFSMPGDFPELGLERQLDFWIDRWLPLLVDWISGWLAIIDSREFSIEFDVFRYEDFAADNKRFLSRLCAFIGVPENSARVVPTPTPGDLHFRKGLVDEWKDVMTDAQEAKATALIPKWMRERFSWD
ncbi:MAG: sulfotransferase domain-containing protein [Acidobacteria bacterium]|nr:sulfotransferase domain-containing protein [Acidobacteriota bacterium]